MSNFQVIGRVGHIDGVSARFSSHLAAFEACQRIKDPAWSPFGRETWFEGEDSLTFAKMQAAHQERAV